MKMLDTHALDVLSVIGADAFLACLASRSCPAAFRLFFDWGMVPFILHTRSHRTKTLVAMRNLLT